MTELAGTMFDGQFGVAKSIASDSLPPLYVYAVETAIQLTLTELNENLREIYVVIDAANFPDANFRAFVKSYDKDDNDILSASELEAVKEIDCNSGNISSLTGSFDVKKASDWSGATVTNGKLTIPDGVSKVTYTYDIGQNWTKTFTLHIHSWSADWSSDETAENEINPADTVIARRTRTTAPPSQRPSAEGKSTTDNGLRPV